MTEGEVYRTPALATVPAARLAAVVQAYRQELVVLARDQAYAGAAWALEAIDTLVGRVRELERQLPAAAAVEEPAVMEEPPAAAKSARRGRG